MNRLHQLKETFIQNIRDNENYDNLEFVLLNYNSTDDMDEWVKENLMDEITSGKVVYYHTTEPEKFSHSHSKNLAFKLASGAIVCSINADHFTGKGFAAYVNNEFSRSLEIVLTTVDYFKTKPGYNPPKDVFGRVCVRKADFMKVGGFDEQMENYGFEDWDFVNRLEMLGCERVLIDDFSYLNFISHSEQERYSLGSDTDLLYGIYINYLTPSKTDVIFLFKNRTFERGTLIDNSTVNSEDYQYAYKPRSNRFEYSLEEKIWQKGFWDIEEGFLKLSYEGGYSLLLYHVDSNLITDIKGTTKYFLLSYLGANSSLITFNYFYQNRSLMEIHLEERTTSVNKNGFGLGRVAKNFSLQPFIYS